MAKLQEFKEGDLPQAEIVVIPIIDVSHSMRGSSILQVNKAIKKAADQLRKINESLLDTKLLIAPIEFSTGARWIGLSNDMPAEPDKFVWQDLKAAGQTDFGEALSLLCDKLTVVEKGGWMKGRGGLAPVLILISDGGPTDSYKNKLKDLKNRGWFSAALKFAIAVEGAKKDVLAEFTGNMELVWDVKKLNDDIEKIVRAVVVSASKTASKTASTSTSTKNISVVSESGSEVNDITKKEAETSIIEAVNATLDDTDDWGF